MGRNGWYRAIVGGTALCVVAIAVTGAAFVRRDVHAEYVKYLSGKDTITGYLAYPERKDPAPAVVVVFEIFGMSDFVRQTTEQLARDGFVALAPDLLSRRGGPPPSTDDARKLIAGLNPDTLTLDLDATVTYLKTLKAVRGDRIGVIGFCWGGGQSFRYATNSPALPAYGGGQGPLPDAAAIARIHAQGLGVYAENDARIDAGLTDVAGAGQEDPEEHCYTLYP